MDVNVDLMLEEMGNQLKDTALQLAAQRAAARQLVVQLEVATARTAALEGMLREAGVEFHEVDGELPPAAAPEPEADGD